MTAKEYLHSIKIKDAIINNLQHNKEDLRDMLYSLGGTEGGDRVQNSRNNDKFGTLYARIDDKEHEITEKIDELVDFKLRVSDEINALPDSRYSAVLHKRHIQFQSWGRIAADLNYNIRYVQQLNGEGLMMFEEMYADMLKNYS